VLETCTLAFRDDEELILAIRKSFDLMLDFYGFRIASEDDGNISIKPAPHFSERARQWLTPNNHNFLRITRIMKSLSLLGLQREAAAFWKCLDDVYEKEPEVIGPVTKRYWDLAGA